MATIQSPTGTNDILPEDQKYWRFLQDTFEKKVKSFGLEKIETPIMEYKSVFARSIGDTTDIVEKEMFEVTKTTGPQEENQKDPLVLRPEGTAGVVRAYIQHGMQTWPQPIKLYYWGPMFRYDRPQKGRYRQFWQGGIEILGDAEPLTDTISILIFWQLINDLGLKDSVMIGINSIGCKSCRPKFRKKLIEYYQNYRTMLCDNCQRRLDVNPLRILDCKEERCQKINATAPQIIDNLCPDCKSHFMKVLEYLDELNIPYDLNSNLVRGLDYYTRTTFEFYDQGDAGRQSSLGGGGRYDNLVEAFGGPATPAIGWSIGCERIIEKIKESKINVPEQKEAEIYLIQLGERARKRALSLVSELSQKGYAASCVLGKESLKSQLRSAEKMQAKITLIIGQREVLDGTIIARDMIEGTQETINMDKLEKYLQKKIKR